MMVPVIDAKTGAMNPSAIQELLENNCTLPNISNVIFNLKTHEAARDAEGKKIKDENGNVKMVELKNPILATTLVFIDGTKTTVKNSGNDQVTLVKVGLDADGNVIDKLENAAKVVTTASEASKELGIVYGIWKRITGAVDGRGTVTADGAGRILREVVNAAYDTTLEESKNILKKAAAKVKHEELQKAAQENAAKNPSLAKTVKDLSATVEKLTAVVEALAAKQ